VLVVLMSRAQLIPSSTLHQTLGRHMPPCPDSEEVAIATDFEGLDTTPIVRTPSSSTIRFSVVDYSR
jgi:hypothetical protein